MKAPLLMFGEDWHGLPSSTRHLANQFLHDRHVTWVNSIGLRRPKLGMRDLARAAGKFRRMLHRPSRQQPLQHDHLNLVDPRAVAWPGSRLASRINRQLLGQQLRKALRNQGLARPVLWTSLPTAIDIVGTLDERALVYYCCDDFSDLVGVDHKPVAAMEAALAKAADLIVVVNDRLAAKFDPAKTVIVPHGVDLDIFTIPRARAVDLPKAKTAGFYGSLADWIDIELIAETATLRPEWQFFLIGPVKTDVSALQNLPNVTLAGARAHHDLPGYSQHWQVSMLPFRDTDQIRNCNPLKLREYLAAGPPIVATPCPAVEAYGAAKIVRDAKEFAQALDRSSGDYTVDARRGLVAAESWQVRAKTISDLMDNL